LIPKGTILLSAAVKDGIAYLNFNESFKFNTMGVEGYMAQLKQIVFTSTEFSTVKKVQFLVEGELVEFLSGEGVYIGKPLDRSSFS
jgi:spore germination protein GerM